MNRREAQLIADLIGRQRWAALATQGINGPEVSWAAHVPEADCSTFLLHLSALAAHTRNLQADRRAGLALSQPEQAGADPQTLARLMMQGCVEFITRDDPGYPAAAARYQARLPEATRRFALADFQLLRFIPNRIRFVGGFGRAYTLDRTALRAAIQAD